MSTWSDVFNRLYPDQEYRTTCLLGCETDTYDSEGARVRTAPWKHVTRDKVEDVLAQFRGEIQQIPPMCVTSPPFPSASSISELSY